MDRLQYFVQFLVLAVLFLMPSLHSNPIPSATTAPDTPSATRLPAFTEEELAEKRDQLFKEHNFSFANLPNECIAWLTCTKPEKVKYVRRKVDDLPQCPCKYPYSAIADPEYRLHDPTLNKTFQWRDAGEVIQDYDREKYGATRCVRSFAYYDDPNNLMAQVCCYDSQFDLITRGGAAGGFEMLSPDRSQNDHILLDYMPYVVCKMNWRAIQTVKIPNTGVDCPENPSQEEYNKQLETLENS